jgi:outer membrane biosynthesis protein TonB
MVRGISTLYTGPKGLRLGSGLTSFGLGDEEPMYIDAAESQRTGLPDDPRSEGPQPAPPKPEEPKPQPPQPEIPPSGPDEPHLPSPGPEPLPTPVPGPTDPALPRPVLYNQ